MIFKSTVGKWNKYIYIVSILLLLILTIPSLFKEDYNTFVISSSIHLLLILLLIWTYKTTFYSIENMFLHWKSGPFNGKIAIDKIHKIEYHKGIVVPTIWKPALSHIGLIITYNKYDDIYISPENQEEFIATLQSLNLNITIKNTPYV